MRAKNVFFVTPCIAMLVLGGCAAERLPSNVSLTPVRGDNAYLNTVDFSYPVREGQDYDGIKLCVAENVINDSLYLKDESGSFVDHRGVYRDVGHSSSASAGVLFKYEDRAEGVLIASGQESAGSVAMGLTQLYVKYDLKVAIKNSRVSLVFSHIQRAQKDTGSASNEGFGPVGNWAGSNAMKIYQSLSSRASSINLCIQRP